MSFRPIGKWVSIRFHPPKIRSDSGIYYAIPIYSQIATIIATGDQVDSVLPGDTVFMHASGDGMATQNSIWYYYLSCILDDPMKAMDFEVMPVVVKHDDIMGKWDDQIGLIPTRNNVIFKEFVEPEKVRGVIRFIAERQNRKPFGEILRVSDKVKNFKPGQIVLLGRYGGVYYTDLDKSENVIVSTREILGTLERANSTSKIKVSDPREQYDPKVGIELFN